MTTIHRPLKECPAWKALALHQVRVRDLHLRTLFAEDPGRGERVTAEAAGLFLDYSKNRVTDETVKLLLQLAGECGLRQRNDAMFRGDKINVTENRAVLHVALRAPRGAPSSWTARTWCPRCTPCWTKWLCSASACAVASGRGIPASGRQLSSTTTSSPMRILCGWRNTTCWPNTTRRPQAPSS